MLTLSDLPSLATPTLPDDPAAELEAATLRDAELRAIDDGCCRECGHQTSGCIIGGTWLPCCDRCVIHYCVCQMGADLVRAVLHELEAEGLAA